MSDVLECCGIGAFSKLAIGKTGSTLTRMDFLNFVPNIVKVLADGSTKAIRGTLDHQATSVAEGVLHVRFKTTFWVTPDKMAILMLSLGFTASGDTWTMGDVIPDSTIVLTPGGAEDFTFTGCIPANFIISGQKGVDPQMIEINWVGKTMTSLAGGTFSYGTMLEGYPFAYATQGTGNANTVTLGSPYSTTIKSPQIKLYMDYHLIVEFNNSVTAVAICPSDHDMTIGMSALFSNCDGTMPLLDLPVGGQSPTTATPLSGNVVGSTLVWNMQRLLPDTNNSQCQISLANVKPIAQFPRIVKNDLNRLPLNFRAYASGSTAMCTILNVIDGV